MSDSQVRGRSDTSVVKPTNGGRNGDRLDRIMAEWRFLSLVFAFAMSVGFAVIRYQDILNTQGIVVTEIERQSMADSMSSFERWYLNIGLTYQICWSKADTLTLPADRALARRGCDDLLRFAPRLQRGELPPPPQTSVFRINDQMRRFRR